MGRERLPGLDKGGGIEKGNKRGDEGDDEQKPTRKKK